MKTGVLIFILCAFAFLFFLIRSEKFQQQWDAYDEASRNFLKLCLFGPLAILAFAFFVILILPW